MVIRFTTFINEDFLLENRVQFLKDQNPTIDTSHDTLAKHKDAGDIVDHFAKKADPTPNKAHTQWIVNQYKKKSIRQEDAPQIKSTLNDFAQVKDRLEKKDINQYKDIGELRDAVSTQKTQAAKAVKEKAASATNKTADLKKMYDSDGVTGYKIPNKEVSIKNYGPAGEVAPTHWCTAANSDNNMFNHYKGGKYTMHFPSGHVLQFHHQSNQIMDKNDQQIQPNDPRFQEHEHHIAKFLKQTKELEGSSTIDRFHHYEPHEVDHAINDYSNELNKNKYRNASDLQGHDLHKIAKHAALSDHQFESIHNLPAHKGYWGAPVGPAMDLSSNPQLTHSQVGKLLSSDTNKDHHVEALMSNPAVKGEHIDKLLKVEHADVTSNPLASNPNLQPHHIDSLMAHTPNHIALVKNNAITLSHEQQKAIAASPDVLATRADIHPDIVQRIIDHHSNRTTALDGLITNPNVHLSDEHMAGIHRMHPTHMDLSHTIFDSPKTSPEVREKVFDRNLSDVSSHVNLRQMINSKHFTKQHLDRVLNKADELESGPNLESASNRLRDYAAKYLKASPSQIDRQVQAVSAGRGKFNGYEMLDNKNLKPDHLKKIYDSSNSEWAKQRVLDHPAVTSDVLHHAFDNGHGWDKTKVLHHDKVQQSHFQKAMDIGQTMHGAVSSSPSAPPSILSKLADSPFSFVRGNVASHKNTPQEALANLANDSDKEVASTAKKRLKIK